MEQTALAESNRPAHWFKPGQSGNPKGRPVGTRVAVNEKFISALARTFDEYGEEALRKVAVDDPSTFVKVLAALQPKEIDIKNHLGDITDEQLEAVYLTARAVLAGQNLRTGNIIQGETQPTEEVQALPKTVGVP